MHFVVKVEIGGVTGFLALSGGEATGGHARMGPRGEGRPSSRQRPTLCGRPYLANQLASAGISREEITGLLEAVRSLCCSLEDVRIICCL